jgi:hypothetical protein
MDMVQKPIIMDYRITSHSLPWTESDFRFLGGLVHSPQLIPHVNSSPLYMAYQWPAWAGLTTGLAANKYRK